MSSFKTYFKLITYDITTFSYRRGKVVYSETDLIVMR